MVLSLLIMMELLNSVLVVNETPQRSYITVTRSWPTVMTKIIGIN